MSAARAILSVMVLALALAGCLETAGNNYVVYEPGTNQKAKSSAGKSSAKKTATAQTAAKPKTLGDNVHRQLYDGCVLEHGGLLGGGEKIAKQCECFAAGLVKSMNKDSLEFYAQYNVLPTLGVAPPDDLKRQCGIAGVRPTGSRASPPPPPGT